MCDIKNEDGISYLKSLDDISIDLVLTDPPYITSKDTGMNKQYDKIKEKNENTHTEDQQKEGEEKWIKYGKEKATTWVLNNEIINFEKGKNVSKSKLIEWGKIEKKEEKNEWLVKNNITTIKKRETKIESYKDKYIKYGAINSTKYGVKTQYGDWDTNFTIEMLEQFVTDYFRVLKDGGTVIIFFDIWKITYLKEIMEKAGFKDIRFIEWIKTNPQPLNSSRNYLTNCREIALLGVKKYNTTINNEPNNGVYKYPLQGGNKTQRFHPTQKSLPLFEELIKHHSNEHDVVLDTFLGSGTTAVAAKKMNRIYKGCERDKIYFDKMLKRLE